MSNKKRIIVVFEYGTVNGGAAKVAIQTAISLSKQGYEVTYFCACGPIEEKLKNSVLNVICLNQYDILNNPSRFQAVVQGIWNTTAYKKFNYLLDTFNGDSPIVLIHGYSHILSSSIIKACQKHNIKPYITLHDYFSVCPNGGFYNYQLDRICKKVPMSFKCTCCNCDSRNYLHKCYRVIRQFVQDKYIRFNKDIRYIYISNFSLSKMKQYLRSNNFYYVHNPIEPMLVSRNEEANEVFFIGRLSPEKGADIFCEAVNELSLNGVVVGEGPQKEKLKEKYNFIKFMGWKSKEEIQQLLSNAKCLVFPSKWYETDGLIVQECLSAGIPCIVSNECSATEYIENGVNGYLFEVSNKNDLVDKLRSFDIQSVRPLSVITEENYIKNLLSIIDME